MTEMKLTFNSILKLIIYKSNFKFKINYRYYLCFAFIIIIIVIISLSDYRFF